jgi:hypothetical protein
MLLLVELLVLGQRLKKLIKNVFLIVEVVFWDSAVLALF